MAVSDAEIQNSDQISAPKKFRLKILCSSISILPIFYQFLTEDAILEVLRETKIAVHHIEEFTHYIIEGARRTFGILILIRGPECISDFIRSDQFQSQSSQLDHKIPFRYETLETILPKDNVADFFETQWEFTAPVFARRVLPRLLEEDTVMPFLDDVIVGEGGFGVVHEIKLHPFHQSFSTADEQRV